MKQNQVEVNGSQLTISTKKAPLFIRIVLIVVLSIFILIPIAVTVFVLGYGDGPHIGIAISYLVSWGFGFYLLRVVLWNSVGREILILNSEKITYIADYRLFKDGRHEITTQDLKTEIIYEGEAKHRCGRLRLTSKSATIETVLETTIIELEELIDEIKTRYHRS